MIDDPFSLALRELEIQNQMANNLIGDFAHASQSSTNKKDQSNLDDLINFRNNNKTHLQTSPQQMQSTSLKPIHTNQIISSPLRQQTGLVQMPQRSPNKFIFQKKPFAPNSSTMSEYIGLEWAVRLMYRLLLCLTHYQTYSNCLI